MPGQESFGDIEECLVVFAKSNTDGSTYECLSHTWAEHNYLMLIINALRVHRSMLGGNLTVSGNAERGRITVQCPCCDDHPFDVEWDSKMIHVA